MSSRNKKLVPQAKSALDKFKMEAANEVGVNLTSGYNGDLTSKQAGSVGGQMVNNICPIRTMTFSRNIRTKMNHELNVHYKASIIV
ncbi:MAG: alpha/beta-type small acid-soluble spore protein [Clostridia bacterium]|nr:alpha/beta-type small acid-soluble spore protein [Clostridia bacterium]